MKRRVRVLVVDDSVVARKAVTEMLGSEPDLEVIGTASNGKIALDRIVQQSPDLVVLDVEMPEMNGLDALRHIRALHPRLPVLMFSALTEKGAMLTLDALSLGASDYVTKPAHVGKHQITLDDVRAQLLAKVRALSAHLHVAEAASAQARRKPPAVGLVPARIEVVVIGASTGGPNALAELCAVFSRQTRVPVLIVQHMPPVFTRIFAERLATQHDLEVREAVADETVRPGQVWVAPGDFHMVVGRVGSSVRLGIHQGPAENSCRPAVDVLFRSAVEVYDAGVLGVVLTGMGQDGLRGAEEIRRAGGQVVVQDAATSVVWSMPGSVAKANLADAVLPLSDIGPEILRRVGGSLSLRAPGSVPRRDRE